MADAGLRVYAQDGSGALQIDNAYRNYFLRSKQTVTLNEHNYFTGSSSCGEKWINIACQTTPLVVIAASGTGATVATVLSILPPASGHNTPGTYSIAMLGPFNATVDVYIFDALTAADMAVGGWGLRVWNAAGQPIFNSNAKPLRVVGKLTASPTSSPTGIAIPAGKKYGVLCNNGFYTQEMGGSPAVFLYFAYGGAITTSGFATIGIIQTGSVTSSATILSQSTTAFVVDLTNY